MAIELPQQFRPPPLLGPEAPVAQRAEALRRRISFEAHRARFLEPDRVERLRRLEAAISRPIEGRVSPSEVELERIERASAVEGAIPERIPEGFTVRPERVPEPLETIAARPIETVTRQEAVERLREFAPALSEEVTERLVARGPTAIDRFIELQLRERPEAKLTFGIGARFQALEQAGEFAGVEGAGPGQTIRPKDVVESLKEVALDITPVIGDKRAVEDLIENWDRLSTSDKVASTALTTLGALGTVSIVGGPIKYVLKSQKGPGTTKVSQTLVTSEADEAASLLRSTVGRRTDAADEVREIVKELEQLHVGSRTPLGQADLARQTAAKNRVEQVLDADNVPEAVNDALASLDQLKLSPTITRTGRQEELANIQNRLGNLTEDLASGQKTPVEFRLSASTTSREQDRIQETLRRVADTPGSIKGSEKVILEAPATPEGARALIETDNLVQQVTTNIPIDTRRLLDRKMRGELVVETGGPAATTLKEIQNQTRRLTGTSRVETTLTDVRRSVDKLINSRNPRRDLQDIITPLNRLERARELNPDALSVVNRLRDEARLFAFEQQQAINRAREIANTLSQGGVRNINLRAVIKDTGGTSELDSLARTLIQGRGEGKDLTQLIRVKQQRGEDVTDLLGRQKQFEDAVQGEIRNLSKTFGTEDPEATRRFAQLLQDSLKERRITSDLQIEELGRVRPLSEVEARDLANLEETYAELLEASRSVNAAVLRSEELRTLKTGDVLDIGTGITPSKEATHGIDIQTRGSLETFAREVGQDLPSIDIRYGTSSSNIPFVDNSFDKIVSDAAFVIRETPETLVGHRVVDSSTVQEMHRVLTPNGRIDIEVIPSDPQIRRFGTAGVSPNNPDIADINGIAESFRQQGFENVKWVWDSESHHFRITGKVAPESKITTEGPIEALSSAKKDLRTFEETQLPRLRELRTRPKAELDPDIRSISLEPEPLRPIGLQPEAGPSPFGAEPPGGGLGFSTITTRRAEGGIAVLERPTGVITPSAPPTAGATAPRLEVVTSLRTLTQPRSAIPVALRVPFGTVEAPEREAPDIELEPEISPNGVPEVIPEPERRRPSVPRRAPIGPARTAPEPGIVEPEVIPTREPAPETQPTVVPVPEEEPVVGVPPGFRPVPTPAAFPGVRIVPTPLDLPFIDIDPELGMITGEDILPLRGIFPDVETGIDQPTTTKPRELPQERPRVTPQPLGRPDIIPGLGELQLPEEETVTGFEPELFTPVEPLPEIIPEELPEEETRVPTRLRPPETPRVPKPTRAPPLPSPGEQVREMRRPGRPRAQGVTWKQGEIWISIFPPFNQEDIFHTRSLLPSTRRVRSPRQAFKFIEDRTGSVPAETYDEWATWFLSEPSTGETPVF